MHLRRLVVPSVGAGLFLLASTGLGWAAPASVTIDDTAPTMAAATGGGHTMKVVLRNATRDATANVVVSAPVQQVPPCTLAIDPKTLAPATTTTATITVPKECSLHGGAIAVQVMVDTNGEKQTFDLIASGGSPAPDWRLLKWFFVSLIIAAVTVVGTYVRWGQRTRGTAGQGLLAVLPAPSKDWSFNDSWASNATIAATIFTGVLGSTDVLKALLGSTPDNVIAEIAVASALATAMVGAGPLVLRATGSASGNRIVGILAAAVLTVAGVGGQLAVIIHAGTSLNLSGYEHWLPWLGGGAAATLVLYAINSLWQILRGGYAAKQNAARSAASQLRARHAKVKVHAVEDEHLAAILNEQVGSWSFAKTVATKLRESDHKNLTFDEVPDDGTDQLAETLLDAPLPTQDVPVRATLL